MVPRGLCMTVRRPKIALLQKPSVNAGPKDRLSCLQEGRGDPALVGGIVRLTKRTQRRSTGRPIEPSRHP